MTLKELIQKYPKIFESYDGNPYGVNWEAPKAWLPVIDDMCGAIQDYIEGVYSFKDGVAITIPQVKCVQMKEKWGGLRFYTSGGDEATQGMIRMAAYICRQMCESCGTRENIGRTDGWVSICCKPCYEAGNAGGGDWEPLNK